MFHIPNKDWASLTFYEIGPLQAKKLVMIEFQKPVPWPLPELDSSFPAFEATFGIGDDNWYDNFFSIGE